MQLGIFPIGGEGRRFNVRKFVEPKPFIKIFGRTQLEWSVMSCRKNFPEAKIVIGYRSGLKAHSLEFVETSIKELGVNIEAIDIGQSTLGAAHTVALVLNKFRVPNEDFEFLVLDNDVAIELSTESHFKDCAAGLVTSESTNPSHSFVIYDEQKLVSAIEEKIVISKNGVVGNYFFKSAIEFLDHYKRLPPRSGERYISGVVKSYLSDNLPVSAKSALHVCSFGTPEELASLSPESFKFLGVDRG
jgi:NDP-sugar pyrophosphorylase family protein